jgi:thiol-disulfide isomerase/thioredoxin
MLHLKNLIPGLLLLGLPFSSHATKTILCGQFKYKPQKTATLLYYASPIDAIEHAYTKVESDVNANGSFKLELDVDKPTLINLMNGSDWVFYRKFINPGDSLHFDFDSTNTNVEGIGENGIGGMFQYDANTDTKEHSEANHNSFVSLTDAEFAKYWDAITDGGLAFYNKYFAEHPAPAQYVAAVKAELEYNSMIQMVQFGWRAKNGNPDFLNKPEYMRCLNKYAYNDSNALVSNDYLFFIDQLTWYLPQPMGGRSAQKIEFYQWLRLRDSVAKHHFAGKVYDVALYGILYDAINNVNTSKGRASFDTTYAKTATLVDELGRDFHDKSLLVRINEKLKVTREEGKPAPDFIGTTLDGKKVRLSDFKGKVVYVDFWSTNCPPCVAELPYIKRLQEKYKGEDVVFLYFSFDHSAEVLKHFIKEKNFTGVHVNDPKEFASDAAIKYHINSIPRHIIVDKNGILVNSDAPRPSSQPEQILDKALGKSVE